MVNFEAEQTVATPAAEVVKILILQRRDNALNALIHYQRQKVGGSQGNIASVSEAVLALFLEVSAALKRKWKGERQKEYITLKTSCHSLKFETLYAAYETICDELDAWGLTRVDTKEVYDTRNAEGENERGGF